MKSLLVLAFLAGMSGLFLPPDLSAHALHISLCEADYRAETGKLEVALRLFTDDAEVVLSRRTGRSLVIEQTSVADRDRLLFAYAQSTFVLKKRDGSIAPLRWIGHEIKDANQHLWLYFESTLPEGVEGLRIDDRVMRETFSDQLNSVLIREHSTSPSKQTEFRQITLLFPDAAERTVTFAPEK